MNDCFFVDAKVQGKKIEIFVDRDGGISFDICHKLSRHLEEILDRDKPFGESYTLDVSSPGVGNPLKLPRQYKNNLGRKIEITTQEKTLKGLLKIADDSSIGIEVEEVIKEANKKKKIMVTHSINMVDIIEAKIKISF